MLILGLDIGMLSEVDSDPFTHYCFSIENLADPDCGILVEEGYNNSTERLERGEGMNRRRSIDEIFNSLQVVCSEYFRVLQVRDEKGI